MSSQFKETTLRNNLLAVFGNLSNDLITRARNLEPQALAEIHDQYHPEVYRYVRYRLSDEALVEDITSEVFVRLLDALHRRRGPDQSLRGWLMGTASNLVNDHLRRRYAQPVVTIKDPEGALDLPGGESPESSLIAAWQKQQVREALQRLTQEQQHVLALRFAEERSLDETAEIVGKSINAVKALQFRALASLRRLLEERIQK
jgi:RNA polymerase sigma-70 factor (ECF subfamily)